MAPFTNEVQFNCKFHPSILSPALISVPNTQSQPESVCRSTSSKMVPFIKMVQTILWEIVYIILAVVTSIGFVLLFPLLVPIYIIRWTVAAYAKRFKPGLGKILSVRSSMFATDDVYKRPFASLLTLLVVEGDLTPEEFKDVLRRRLINKMEDEKSETLLFPEMRQYLTTWMGFYFWKPDPDFELDNHINVLPTDRFFDHVAMLEYNTVQNQKPFTSKRSPWEFHLVRNYKPFGMTEEFGMTGVVYRCHHCLADGFSVLNLLASSSDDELCLQQPVRVRVPKQAWKTCLERVAFPFRVPYEAIKVGIESYDRNGLKLPAKKLQRNMVAGYHPLIPITRLKAVKNHFGVSLTSVILEIFTGAVRNFMLRTKVEVPEAIHCLTPLPLPGHSQKLRNHMTGCFTRLPVGTPDPVERLYEIEKNLLTIKQSTFPWTASILFALTGGLFVPMMRSVARFVIGTAAMTNFPGPDGGRVHFFNRPMHELNFGGGIFRGTLSIGMTSISYNGMISFLIGLDSAICPPGIDAKSLLVNLVTQELELLEKSMSTVGEV